MSEARLHIRMDIDERDKLEALSAAAQMTVSDYIKYRVFTNNPDLKENNTIYESPFVDKHNYYVMKGIAHVLNMLMKLLQEQKGYDAFKTFNEGCLKEVYAKLRELGYNKMTLGDE